MLAVLIVVWSQRRPIAAGFIDRALASRQVAAQYRIADIGFNRQRLTDVVIGDPSHPDLVADWVEVTTQVGLSGATVTGIRAGAVRVRGALVDGRLAFGALDRLLPASGKPLALPALDLEVADGRLRLTTPLGIVGAKLSGHGRLDNGFTGNLALVAETLANGACRAERIASTLTVRITDGQPTLRGPVRAGTVHCGDTVVSRAVAEIDATLGDRFDRWRGRADLSATSLRSAVAQGQQLAGTVDFNGSPKSTSGGVALSADRFATDLARGVTATLTGRYRVEGAVLKLDGHAAGRRIALTPAWQRRLTGWGGSAAGTPVAPLVSAMASAVGAAARSLSVETDFAVARRPGDISIELARSRLGSASGARLTLSGGQGIRYDSQRGVRIDGMMAIAGGGLPEAAITLAQTAPGAPVTGTALVRPYAAGDARLALSAVKFTASPGGATRIATRATLSGPFAGGRIDAATLPVEALWDGHQSWRINTGCAPLDFARLQLSTLVIGPSRMTLCPEGDALLRLDSRGIGGGVRTRGLRLAGKLGESPITIAADSAHYGLTAGALDARAVAVGLGNAERRSQVTLAMLDGRVRDAGLAGRFTGGAGRIGRVPLLASAADGDWRWQGGQLAVNGGLTLADADAEPRFKPLVSRDVVLTLADNHIVATGTLRHPETGTTITRVALAHDLAAGSGHADLIVDGIDFDDRFQPDRLTRLTYGVIADVVGRVTGEGHVRWSGDTVTSDGVFRTTNASLAAAFGPVAGLSTEIRFTDLLNLVSAPGQVATVASINPGVPVVDGVLRYQTLADQRVAIAGAYWPFAGGDLVLEPTILDFTEHKERRLTFRVTGVDAGQFLQQFDFKNLDATGIFDGVLPMVFDQRGGRIENGRLAARAAGGGTIAYVGEVSQKDLGFWANMAFQALKSLRYRTLDIVMNGPLAGEMITEVRFAGISQGAGAKRNFLIRRLQKLPLVFNVRIEAPFRQLIDSAQTLYDPKRLIERNLPALIRAQNERRPPTPPIVAPPVQPPESENKP